MNRFRAGWTLVVCVAVAGTVAGQRRALFRGTGDVVQVFVTVTDRAGRLVTTLTRNDFEVRDEGGLQFISQFDNSPRPLRLIVMLDVSGSMEGNLPLLRAAALQLFARLRKDDVVRVGTFGNDVSISPSFSDPDKLQAALPTAIAADAPTPLWLALNQALDALGDARDKRRVILVLSDGIDNGPLRFRQRAISEAETIERGRREDVMIYAVGMRSRIAQPTEAGIGSAWPTELLSTKPDPGLARVAEDTGGGYTEIHFGQDLRAAFAGIADELHSQYLLGYAPPKRDGRRHEIKVSLPGRDLTPRARRSYIAPKD